MALELAALASGGASSSYCGLTIVPTKYPVVAVIDDDRAVLDALTRLLPTHGFDVELYVSPGKFLEVITTTQAICLIVEVKLGDACGVAFVRQLAKCGITFPVIFLGGSIDQELERPPMETGCVAFFRKPFSGYLLIEALYDLADSYSVRRGVM
jgi:FixJ family two-component response regulator